MLQFLKKLFGGGSAVSIGELLQNGATVLDVRTKGEYARGHVRGSLNIPLGELGSQLKRLKDKNHPVITCCASGMRSASAKSFLAAQGYTNVHNGGSWMRVNRYVN